MSRAEKMYAKSPRLARDEESGKVKIERGVKEAEKKSDEVAGGTQGVLSDEIMKRQAKEHFDMYHRHMSELFDHYGKNKETEKE